MSFELKIHERLSRYCLRRAQSHESDKLGGKFREFVILFQNSDISISKDIFDVTPVNM